MSNYYKVSFTIRPSNSDAADLLAAFLADTGFESFEETEIGVDAYVQESQFDATALEDVIENFPFDVVITWDKEFMEQKDWNEEWEKKYFKPLLLGAGRCVVHSTFHKDFPPAEYEIIIDPKMAFGTGHHATTTMMANHLFNLDLTGTKVVDMGTGTGILAILASKLGAGEVAGIEIDSVAFENAVENAVLNDTKVDMIFGDSSQLKKFHDIDVFLANINRNIILADIDRYVETLHAGGIILLSGFYKEDVGLIEKALNSYGVDVVDVDELGNNWASIKAVKISEP